MAMAPPAAAAETLRWSILTLWWLAMGLWLAAWGVAVAWRS